MLPIALISVNRKRKFYAGDFSSDDFASPRKAKKNYRILRDKVVSQRKEIHKLHVTVASLRKRVKTLTSLLKVLRSKSYITESSETMITV